MRIHGTFNFFPRYNKSAADDFGNIAVKTCKISIRDDEQFHLWPQCFQKLSAAIVSKCVCRWERVNMSLIYSSEYYLESCYSLDMFLYMVFMSLPFEAWHTLITSLSSVCHALIKWLIMRGEYSQHCHKQPLKVSSKYGVETGGCIKQYK